MSPVPQALEMKVADPTGFKYLPSLCNNLDADDNPECAPIFEMRRIFVMGGRARALSDMPLGWERIHGGIVPPRGSRKRELTVRCGVAVALPTCCPSTYL